jgi:hypothetical protein
MPRSGFQRNDDRGVNARPPTVVGSTQGSTKTLARSTFGFEYQSR